MVNSINTIKGNAGVIAKLAAGMLVDNLQFAKSIGQADPSDYKGKNGYSAGDTVYISKPARFVPTSSFDITSSIQGITEEKVALPLDVISNVAVELDSQELASTINLGSIAERVIKPAVAAIAQDVEKTFLDRAVKATFNKVGTPGSTVFDTDTMLSANQKLDEFLAPMDGERYALLSPAAQRSAVNARKGLFQSSTEISAQYKKGYMGQADGFTYLSNNLMPRLTLGADVTGIAVEASVVAISNGMSTLGVDGVTTGATITAGTVFTIAGVNAVHPQTKADLGYLQQFVVTANAAENGSNQATLSISPSIYYTSGDPRQNVTAAPVDETGTLTFVGSTSTTYTENLAYHKDAFRMVSVPLVMPDAVEIAAQETYKGVTIAIVRAFDVIKRRMITRLDFLGGFAAVRPEWACRIGS
jgi:hypothetical protein